MAEELTTKSFVETHFPGLPFLVHDAEARPVMRSRGSGKFMETSDGRRLELAGPGSPFGDGLYFGSILIPEPAIGGYAAGIAAFNPNPRAAESVHAGVLSMKVGDI